MLKFAANVPSGIAVGETLIPPNPVSPFRNVKVDRYVPGGGSNLVGDVGEEHAPMSIVQRIVVIAKTIEVRHRIATDARKSRRWCLCGSIHPARRFGEAAHGVQSVFGHVPGPRRGQNPIW
jgi:hypothetical protein